MADANRGVLARIGRVVVVLVSASLGAVTGFLVTLGIVVVRARLGSFVYALEDMVAVRWETLPILLGTAMGVWLGVRDTRAMARAVLAGAVGMAVGIGVGAAVGALLSDTAEGVWSGLIIGGVLGMLVASLASLISGRGGVTFRGSGPSS